MKEEGKKRASFSGKIGYVLAAAGSAVGLGNIWRFPYLTAKYGGGMFLLSYIVLALTFGFTMMVSEVTLGRMTRRSPIGAFTSYSKKPVSKFGGWLNAVAPLIVESYYCVIGGWVLKYLFEYLRGNTAPLIEDGYFNAFVSNGAEQESWFIVFMLFTFVIIVAGVNAGIERMSKIMMPLLILLALCVAIYSMTRPGAIGGVKYLFIPDFKHFSWLTIVAAAEQMFYSLSIAMGILYTYGSYMKREVDMESSTWQVQLCDTGIAVLAALMIIPAVFAFSGGDKSALNAGPSLMFVTIPKVFASMPGGRIVGIAFFLLVFFAALTSSIALMETGVSTFEDELHCGRKNASFIMLGAMFLLGSLSALGYSSLANVTVFKMQFLDFFDFLANSLIMPLGGVATCILILRKVTPDAIVEEVHFSSRFKAEGVYRFCLKYLAPLMLAGILVASVLQMLGIIKI